MTAGRTSSDSPATTDCLHAMARSPTPMPSADRRERESIEDMRPRVVDQATGESWDGHRERPVSPPGATRGCRARSLASRDRRLVPLPWPAPAHLELQREAEEGADRDDDGEHAEALE